MINSLQIINKYATSLVYLKIIWRRYFLEEAEIGSSPKRSKQNFTTGIIYNRPSDPF